MDGNGVYRKKYGVCVFTEKEQEWEWGERGCFLIPRGDVSDELED